MAASTPITGSVEWNGRTIPYTLTTERREDLAITVHPDLRVSVRAPASVAPERIRERLRARRAWIARQLRDFESYHPLATPRRFIAGETHWYLGRQYRLKTAKGTSGVTCAAGYLHVTVSSPEKSLLVEEALNRWYASRATEVFSDRLAHAIRHLPRLARVDVTLRIRRMTRRWGSCAPSGTVTLNTALVLMPKACIDYVIIHELCHLIVPSHSPKFFALLARCMPDWETRRARLNRLGAAVIAV